jgi:thioredoxin 1
MGSRRLCVILIAACLASASALGAAAWKLVLKDGSTIECDGPPVVVNGSYLFRGVDGKDGSVPSERIDVEGTALANRVDPRPRWRELRRGAQDPNARLLNAPSGAGIITLTDASFDSTVLNSDVPVLVDFWAAWCGPCRRLAPEVDAISGEYAGRLRVGKLDIDANEATTDRFRVEAIPTLLLFKNGQVVARMTGAVSQGVIARMIQPHL